MTTNISLSDAQAILSKLIEAQKEDPIGALQSITVGGRTYSFKSADELIKMINYWSGIIAQLKRTAAGTSTFGRSAAVFTR
jgi:hypothetical protein